MTLISLVLTLVIVGFLVWLILQIPLQPPFPKILVALVIFFMVLWLLQSFGLINTGLRLR